MTSTALPLERKNRLTRTIILMGRSADFDLDAENDGANDWWTICEDHGTVASHETRRLAESFMAVPNQFCDECRRIAPEC